MKRSHCVEEQVDCAQQLTTRATPAKVSAGFGTDPSYWTRLDVNA